MEPYETFLSRCNGTAPLCSHLDISEQFTRLLATCGISVPNNTQICSSDCYDALEGIGLSCTSFLSSTDATILSSIRTQCGSASGPRALLVKSPLHRIEIDYQVEHLKQLIDRHQVNALVHSEYAASLREVVCSLEARKYDNN